MAYGGRRSGGPAKGGSADKEHAFHAFNRQVKEDDIPPVLFVYGEEDYLIRWLVETLVSRYVAPGCESLDFVRFTEGDEDPQDIVDACNTFSMFSARRIVWARDYAPLSQSSAKGFGSRGLEIVAAYLKSPNPGTVLVFSTERPADGSTADGGEKSELAQLLRENVRCYYMGQVDRPTLLGFIRKRFLEAGVKADKGLLDAVASQSGYYNKESRYRLQNLLCDVEKIAAYAAGGQPSPEMAAAVLRGDEETFIFDLLDAATGRQPGKAIRMLDARLRQDRQGGGGSVLAMLINQFELLLDVAELREADVYDAARIAATLHMNEFRVRKAMGPAKVFGVQKLRQILGMLYEADRDQKLGLLDLQLSLELIFARL